MNVIGNAIKYTKNGSVTVRSLEEDEKMKIQIKDTGIGMSAKDQERLFEKFYRVRNEYTSKMIGTGLGLWITKQLVEMMKGKIYIESIEGTGTQVTLFFPLLK